jgi:putative AlgH/UPF0301 family transcriptional regulator
MERSSMDKKTFKKSVLYLLEHDVIGLSSEIKIKYMKKWIREYQIENHETTEDLNLEDSMKIGQLVRKTMKTIISNHDLSDEKISQLQEGKYSKNAFDINYPFLKKVLRNSPQSQQRKVNGYDRYWEEAIIINGERYFICNDWYERNRSKFINWVN